MIRSCRIPPVLNRVCQDPIKYAMLVTLDGELLGSSSSSQKASESFGTLVAHIANDYQRLGEEMNSRKLQYMMMEMEQGLVGVSVANDCMVIAVADPDAPPGLVKAKLQALSGFIQDSFSLLSDPAA